MNQRHPIPGRLRQILIFFFLLLATPFITEAADNISAHYTDRHPTHLTLEIQIRPPAPASIILIQYLPPGTSLKSATPAYKKYNKNKGEVRWLLRNPTSGVIQVGLDLAGPINPEQARAIIRWVDPGNGQPQSFQAH